MLTVQLGSVGELILREWVPEILAFQQPGQKLELIYLQLLNLNLNLIYLFVGGGELELEEDDGVDVLHLVLVVQFQLLLHATSEITRLQMLLVQRVLFLYSY